MSGFVQDLRLAIRGLRRRPGFATVAASTIALGIAAGGAVWSVVDAVLVRPLPFTDPARLVLVWERQAARARERNVVNPANWLRWRRRSRSFTDLAAFVRFDANLSYGGHPERVAVGYVTGNVFSVLGVHARLGRALLESDSAPGSADVVVLSEGYWRRRFGSDPGALGATVEVNGKPATVVGVMPETVQVPPGVVLWTPLPIDERMMQARGRWLVGIGRLKADVSLSQARDDMDRITARLAVEDPDLDAGWTVSVQPLHADLVREVRPGIVLLALAVLVLLLISCVNVANLLLARAVSREREMAIRRAVGAGRGRLIRQLLTESLVLALSAGIAGALLGGWLLAGIRALLPPEIAEVVAVRYDARAVAGAFVLALLSALLFGVAPALHSARSDLTGALKEGGSLRGAGRDRRRLRETLVVGEVALCTLLLVATGLLLRSLWTLDRVSPGFESKGVLAARISLAGERYQEPGSVARFYSEAVEQLRALPGVGGAAAISWMPLGIGAGTSFHPMDRPSPAPGEAPVADIRVVTPGLFRTLGIPLLRGRDFGPADRAGAPAVAVVNRALADAFWPDGDALGKRVAVNWTNDPEAEIVGVVGDVRLTSLDTPARATIYFPSAQSPNDFMTLMLRTTGPPAALGPGLRATIASLDPSVPVGSVLTLDQVVADSLGSRRFVLLLVGFFGAAALALAGIGLFGVMAYAVSQRTSEVGMRMALGAGRTDVLGLVVGDGMRLAAAGLAVGLVSGLAVSELLASQLFEVRPWDPLALSGVAVTVVAVSLAALAGPAWRAASVDPAHALRAE